jgi:hypothetical protein
MTKTVILLLLLTGVAAFIFLWVDLKTTIKSGKLIVKSEPVPNNTAEADRKIVSLKAKAAKTFASKKGFNESICFLIDMKARSGSNRFKVVDLNNDSILFSAPVTHGRCNEMWLEGRKYGNEPGCGCTSLGRYKIGKSYYGRFGLAYKLHGLDATNNKAFERFVVLHGHDCVPEKEVYAEICQSDGCPTVAPGFLMKLQTIIDRSKKPVLLWIYE